jgi:glutathione-regulated potassium-efflux system ancillary protein KefG
MKTLILFAHPRLERSKFNQAMLKRIPKHADLSFVDLYETYPDFNIDTEREKQRLVEHDLIIWHHPIYWYSCPPLLKQWIDMVLEFQWAYGPGGTALTGKLIFNCVTTGGAEDAYQPEGRNRFTLREFLAPFEQTAFLCKMRYQPPFAIMGTHRLSDQDTKTALDQYERLLKAFLEDRIDWEKAATYTSLNLAVEAQNL